LPMMNGMPGGITSLSCGVLRKDMT